eukprot:g55791.t1
MDVRFCALLFEEARKASIPPSHPKRMVLTFLFSALDDAFWGLTKLCLSFVYGLAASVLSHAIELLSLMIYFVSALASHIWQLTAWLLSTLNFVVLQFFSSTYWVAVLNFSWGFLIFATLFASGWFAGFFYLAFCSNQCSHMPVMVTASVFCTVLFYLSVCGIGGSGGDCELGSEATNVGFLSSGLVVGLMGAHYLYEDRKSWSSLEHFFLLLYVTPPYLIVPILWGKDHPFLLKPSFWLTLLALGLTIAANFRKRLHIQPSSSVPTPQTRGEGFLPEIKSASRIGTYHENATCVICMQETASHAFVPCGHRCVCLDDGERVMNSDAQARCPLCRAATFGIIQIYT